ncbi:MAG: outer membrane protein assembly factor BamC [Gammaproteobacteria bacterium]|nr:outer membrane protein assembly factor BamC [Gammaproteobacteria bacterium]
MILDKKITLNTIVKLSVIAMSSFLTACGFIYGEDGLIKDSTYDYLEAKQIKELSIPEPLQQGNKVNYAVVPAIGKLAQQAPVGKDLNERPPNQVLAVLDNVRVDRLSDRPAIYIQDQKDFVWQSILDYFTLSEISPQSVNADEYTIDTGWVAVDERGVWLGIKNGEEIEEFRAQFQILINTSQYKDNVSLSVVRTKAQRLNEETEKWQDVPTFWDDSVDMLNVLLFHYDNKATERELLAREKLLTGFKVELSTDVSGNPALTAMVSMELAWEKLPRVLEFMKFRIDDKDVSQKIYFFEYKEEAEGFFASLFSDDEQESPLEEGAYQVVLTMKGQMVAFTFKTGDDIPLGSDVLTKLYPKLSQAFGEQQ